MFAPISRTFRESYPDRIQEVPISEYRRNQMVLPVTIEENLTFLAKWQKIFDGNSLVYDYPLGPCPLWGFSAMFPSAKYLQGTFIM